MYGQCEPDSCGSMKVYGFEQAMLMGRVAIIFAEE
jgi:hypothetical protein